MLSCCVLLPGLLLSQWDKYYAQWDGHHGVMMLDMSLEDTTMRADLKYLLAIKIPVTHCGPDNMPDSLGYDIIASLSEKLENYLDIQMTSALIGTHIYNCHWTDYYYIKDSLGLRQFLTNFNRTLDHDVSMNHSVKVDSLWKVYDNFIYPDEYLKEQMSNRYALEDFLADSSVSTTHQKLMHWAFFTNRSDLERYRLVIMERGFKVEDMACDHSSCFVSFSRRERLDLQLLTEVTYHLQMEAKKLGGQYNGWEKYQK